jgi:hypothetical protein
MMFLQYAVEQVELRAANAENARPALCVCKRAGAAPSSERNTKVQFRASPQNGAIYTDRRVMISR